MGINWISRLIIDTFLRLRVNYGGTPARLKTEVNRVLTFNMLHQVAFSSAKSKSNHMKDFRFINIYIYCMWIFSIYGHALYFCSTILPRMVGDGYDFFGQVQSPEWQSGRAI